MATEAERARKIKREIADEISLIASRVGMRLGQLVMSAIEDRSVDLYHITDSDLAAECRMYEMEAQKRSRKPLMGR